MLVILGNKSTPDVMDKLWKKIRKSIIKTEEKSKRLLQGVLGIP